MALDLDKRIDTLAQWMHESKYLVVFTGAGVSTESGLRDFRGPDGLWTRRDKGLSTPEQDWSGVEPNAGHMAITELQNLGKLAFLISQNVDNLHLKSGIKPELLAELHGNLTKVRCDKCDFKMDRIEGERECPLCGGNWFQPWSISVSRCRPRTCLNLLNIPKNVTFLSSSALVWSSPRRRKCPGWLYRREQNL